MAMTGTAPVERGMRTRAVLAIALLIVILLDFPFAGAAKSPLRGAVFDRDGSPVEGASVSVWSGNFQIYTCKTGPDGVFEAEVEADRRYDIYVVADDISTPGTHAEVDPRKQGLKRYYYSSSISFHAAHAEVDPRKQGLKLQHASN
jgi:hypothetical protein